MMKKFLSLAIILFLIIPAPRGYGVFAVEGESAPQAAGDSFETELLKGIKVFDDGVKGSDPVKRGAVLRPMLKLRGLEAVDGAAGEALFKDVLPADTFASDIYAAKKLGIISGNSDGYYYPQENTDFNAAVKMLVAAAGFAGAAEASGGYPHGYLKLAREKKIIHGITDGALQGFTYDALAKLIVNALEVKITDTLMIRGGEAYYATSDRILLDNLGLVKITGIVSQNQYTSLTGSLPKAADRVMIGNMELDASGVDLGPYLGYNVCAYARNTEEAAKRTVYYAYPKRNNVLTISAGDIVDAGFSKEKLQYDDGKTVKSVSMKKYFDFVYNGMACRVYDDRLLMPEYGSLTLVDHDDDEIYDVVFCASYYDVLVSSVDAKNSIVYNKLAAAMELDRSHIVYQLSKGGQKVELGALKEWDSLLVADSGYNLPPSDAMRLYSIRVSDERVAGRVEQLYHEGYEKLVVIDQTAYPISRTLLASNRSDISVPDARTEGSFILNAENYIVGYLVSSAERAKKMYAYLMAAKPVSAVSGGIKVQLFTEKREFIVLDAADRVLLDGESIKKEEIIPKLSENADVKTQLVIFNVDAEKKLNYIDTAKRGAKEDAYTLSAGYESQEPDGLIYKSSQRAFADKVLLSGSTVVFSVPLTDKQNEDLYEITDYTAFENNKYYRVNAYMNDAASFMSSALVYESDSMSDYTEASNLFVVERCYTALDEHGMEAEILSGYDRYKKVELKSYRGAFSNAGLTPGDVLIYSANSKNEVKTFSLIFDYSKNLFMLPSNPSDTFFANPRYMYASVYQRKGSAFTVYPGDPPLPDGQQGLEVKNLEQYNAYVYDRRTRTVTKASAADLRDYMSVGGQCTRIVMSQGEGDAASMILFN